MNSHDGFFKFLFFIHKNNLLYTYGFMDENSINNLKILILHEFPNQ